VKDFFGGARRGGPGRTVRIPGKCGMRNAKRRMGNGEEWAYSEKKRRPRSEEQQQRWAKYGGFEWRARSEEWRGRETTAQRVVRLGARMPVDAPRLTRHPAKLWDSRRRFHEHNNKMNAKFTVDSFRLPGERPLAYNDLREESGLFGAPMG
jgi:hypothetical protein